MLFQSLQRDYALKTKFIALVSLAAILPALMSLAITLSMDSQVEQTMAEQMETITEANISQIAKDVYGLCKTANEFLESEVKESAAMSKEYVKTLGGFKLGERLVSWEAVNEDAPEKKVRVELPEMQAGGVWLGQNERKGVATPIVDDVKKLTGEECTVYQRMNAAGDMLRVASSVIRENGTRSGVGGYIPAKSPSGAASPLISTILQGKTHLGRLFVQGQDYLVEYYPIMGADGEVIGMVGVGLAVKEMSSLRDTIMNTQVGKTGYVWVIGGKGRDRGRYIISKNGARDGEDLWEARDANGQFFVRNMLGKVFSVPPGEPVVYHYLWKNADDDVARSKVASLVYFEPWDWVIGAGMYEDDYLGVRNAFVDSLNVFRVRVLAGGALILTLIVILAVILGARLTRPIESITAISQKIAGGDLHGAENEFRLFAQDYLGKPVEEIDAPGAVPPVSETGRLIFAIRRMTRSLTSLIRQVRESGIQVTASATQIAASAKEVEATVTEQAASTSQVNATSSEISSTSAELVGTLEEVGQSVAEAGTMAGEGRNDLIAMEGAMRTLSDSTQFVSSKLAVISEKANNISAVVTAINKISDQTNLLSLNAAIEAEKAGEYGRGFSVVAREIRRLADQTAAATLDIEQMVKEMQSAVSTEVMEMDKFSEEVRRGVDEVAAISARFGEIIEGVQELGPRFASVNEGMRAQAQGAGQISEAMEQLTEAAGQTKESIMEFNQAALRLNEAVQGLQGEVSRFRIDA